MLLEIKKEKNRYVVLYPQKKAGSQFYIDLANGKIIPGKDPKTETNPSIHNTIQHLANKYPNNKFLQLSLQLTPKSYKTAEDLSNDQLLNDAYSQKYGIDT